MGDVASASPALDAPQNRTVEEAVVAEMAVN
jgi:hypothetical protein